MGQYLLLVMLISTSSLTMDNFLMMLRMASTVTGVVMSSGPSSSVSALVIAIRRPPCARHELLLPYFLARRR